MTLRRYIGRATGTRRRRKEIPKILILGTIAAAVGLILVAVFIMNPWDDRPSEEKGTRPSPGVTPTGTPTTPSG